MIRRRAWTGFFFGATWLASLSLLGIVSAQTETGTPTARVPGVETETAGLSVGRWTEGVGIGFLAETPDDTAFAVNLHADYFRKENFSIGPLLQLGFTDDLAQYGFSGQAKYWMGIPDPASATKLVFQAGVGLVHAAFQNDDTSWLIPLGIGIDHTIASGPSLYATFLLNLTDLDTGRKTEADLMPGVTFGVRF